MSVLFVTPERQLMPYVALIWIFESSGGIPLADSRLIVPDGRAKLIVPYRSDVQAIVRGEPLDGKQHQILLVGIQTYPVTIIPAATATSTIGIELTPRGLYHLFKLNMHELTNRIVSFEDLFGRWGMEVQNQIEEKATPQAKIALLQNVLMQLLQRNAKDYSLLDYTLDLIIQSDGVITVRALQDHVGCSRRYLDTLFREHVGIAPKAYANIVRFQKVHQLWTQRKTSILVEDDSQAYYYDQSHFIKEFKRFTGFTPQRYYTITNEFGESFNIKE